MVSFGFHHRDRHTKALDLDTLIATEGEPFDVLGRGWL